jgi:hypothetical protein
MMQLCFREGTSDAADTYGLPTLTLIKDGIKTSHRAVGGGFDRYGDVIGKYLVSTYQDRLRALAKRVLAVEGAKSAVDRNGRWYFSRDLYGMRFDSSKDMATLDGACDLSSMRVVAERIGIFIRYAGSDGITGSEHPPEYVLEDAGMPACV